MWDEPLMANQPVDSDSEEGASRFDTDMADTETTPQLVQLKRQIPFGVRCVIYSFLDLMTLINVISKLSKHERKNITKTEVLNQPRCLRVHIKEGKLIQFPQLEYCTEIAKTFELCIEKMQEQDVFIFQTVLHFIALQNKQVRVIIGLNGRINSQCFDQAIQANHRKAITSIVLLIQKDSYDLLIPLVCRSFNFVREIELNLNNFALNFDNLPRREEVRAVEKLIIRKNKFLFYPLVTMAENLLEMKLFFKELTQEVQDLTPLRKLRRIEFVCISDSSKYFKFERQHYNIMFADPSQIDLCIRMEAFNIELREIFKKFNCLNYPVKTVSITLKKLKFTEDKSEVREEWRTLPPMMSIQQRDIVDASMDYEGTLQQKPTFNFEEGQLISIPQMQRIVFDVKTSSGEKVTLRYRLIKFSRNPKKTLSIRLEFEPEGRKGAKFIVQAHKFKFCL